jgi:hypothetical protein
MPPDTETATSVFRREAGSSNARDIHDLGAISTVVDGTALGWLSFPPSGRGARNYSLFLHDALYEFDYRRNTHIAGIRRRRAPRRRCNSAFSWRPVRAYVVLGRRVTAARLRRERLAR